jgi:hypothetical protein
LWRALAVALVLSTPAAAQTTEGSIEGTVSDQSGAVLVRASLSARHVMTSVTRTAATDERGVSFSSACPLAFTRSRPSTLVSPPTARTWL